MLKFAIQDFKDDREFKNLSSRTIGSYLLTLNEFQGFCSERELIDVNDIKPNVIKSNVRTTLLQEIPNSIR